MDLEAYQQRLKKFVRDRDWEQFHTPKNLVMSLASEAGELCDAFRWLTPEESANLDSDPEQLQAVADELGDVMMNVLILSDLLGIDLERALDRKISITEGRYPAEQVAGRATKYSKQKE